MTTTTPTAAARVSGTIKALDRIRIEASGREAVPLAGTTKRELEAIALALSGRLGCIERIARAAIQPDPEPQPVSQAALQPDQNISPICQPEPQPVAKVGELATFIGMLARHVPDDKQIKGKALDYLRRHGLQGSPLRDDATPSSAGTVSVEAAIAHLPLLAALSLVEQSFKDGIAAASIIKITDPDDA